MADISALDDDTIDRIAAGEVVERPASVVKELVENSLDAGASRIEVGVKDGGIDGIRVADDGDGMTEQAAQLAVRKHTTSKISDIDDLESGIGTLGFRGEALHAIGAVSRMTVRTRPAGQDEGTELVVDAGEVCEVGPVGCPVGTIVEVEDLFETVPARRKYLKEPTTEFSHVNRVVTGYALSNPDVATSLDHDGRETFATTGDGDLRSTIMAVYGREVAAAMIPVDAGDEDLPSGPLAAVEGLVSHPETTRASRAYMSTYVNGRYVTASVVREAVLEAYGAQLATDRFPFTVLFLDVPAETVDVNVHPRKREVRFADEAAVRDQVRTVVKDALLEEGLLRSGAPRGRSAPEQTRINPDGTSTSDASAETTPTPARDRNRTADAGETAGTGDHDGPRTESGEAPATTEEVGGASDTGESTATREGIPATSGSSESVRTGSGHPRHGPSRSAPQQGTLGAGDIGERRKFDNLPSLQILGQFTETFLVAEADDGLLLVDQHAADERIRYELLRERFADGMTTQELAEPVAVEVTAREAAVFDRYQEALARVGIRASRPDDRTVVVRTVPGLLAEVDTPDLVRDVLEACLEGDPADTVDDTANELLADMACAPAVTANTSLTAGRAVDLLSALDECENPWACPHGRPTVVVFGTDEVEDRFERDYPGHIGRRSEGGP